MIYHTSLLTAYDTNPNILEGISEIRGTIEIKGGREGG